MKIKQDKRNYRKHGDKNKEMIRRSLTECGAGRSILIDNENTAVAGNGVLEQAEKLGIPIRVIESDGSELIAVKRTDRSPDDPKRKELALADNATTDASDWDFEAMARDGWTADDLSDWGVEIPDEFEAEEGKTEPDEVPDVDEKEIFSKHGEVYSLGNHRLMCGDSTCENDVSKLLQECKADLVFTDPPYDLENLVYLDFCLKYSKHNVFVMNSEQRIVDLAARQRKSFRRLFANHFKVAGVLANNQPITKVDYIAEFREEKNKGNFQNLNDHFTTFMEITKIHGLRGKDSFGHKQAKKVELPERFILHYSKVGETVLDLFLGAGSTLIACEKNGRKCIGMEFEPVNCDVIRKRWSEFKYGAGCDWVKLTERIE